MPAVVSYPLHQLPLLLYYRHSHAACRSHWPPQPCTRWANKYGNLRLDASTNIHLVERTDILVQNCDYCLVAHFLLQHLWLVGTRLLFTSKHSSGHMTTTNGNGRLITLLN